MKTSKRILSITLLLTLCAATSFSFGKPLHGKDLNTAENAIEHYIGILNGGTDQIDSLFSAELKFLTPDQLHHRPITRRKLLQFLKDNSNHRLDAKSSYHFIVKTAHFSSACVETDFSTFRRLDFLSLKKENGNWKITTVVVTYPKSSGVANAVWNTAK